MNSNEILNILKSATIHSWECNSTPWNKSITVSAELGATTNNDTNSDRVAVKRANAVPEIDRVIFNDPATIVIWKDGTKTVVKANGEKFDKEKGLAVAIVKKLWGNKGNFNNKFKSYIGD